MVTSLCLYGKTCSTCVHDCYDDDDDDNAIESTRHDDHHVIVDNKPTLWGLWRGGVMFDIRVLFVPVSLVASNRHYEQTRFNVTHYKGQNIRTVDIVGFFVVFRDRLVVAKIAKLSGG